MDWRVVKTGIEMFDALHAYGVGIIAASATNGVVAVQNEGSSYRLSCPCTAVPHAAGRRALLLTFGAAVQAPL